MRACASDRWFYAGCIFLQYPDRGILMVDLLHGIRSGDGPIRIRGIEFLDRVMASTHGVGIAPDDPALHWMTWFVERGCAA